MEKVSTHYATDIESLKKSTRVQAFRASGPGGQHRNKVETGIRLFHDSSGVVVEAKDSRSREKNLEHAFERLQRRLYKLNHVPTPRIPTKVPKAQRKKRVSEKRIQAAKKEQRKPPLSQ